MILDKKIIRKEILELRSTLSYEDVEENSKKVVEKILKTDEFQNADFIMCYVDFKNEVKTKEFIKYCLNKGKRVAVPFIEKFTKNNKKMIASEIYNIEYDMQINSFGILEPKTEILKEVDPGKFDLIIVPGVSFDTLKNRLGFGAGFYDGFLKNTTNECKKIGIAHDFQIVEKLPADAYDIPMDILISEKRTII